MKRTDIEDAIDDVASLLKVFIRRAVVEGGKVVDTVSGAFQQPEGETNNSEERADVWITTLGSYRRSQSSGVTYLVLSFSRTVGGQKLMRIQFADESTGEYPLSMVLRDVVVPSSASGFGNKV